MIRVYVAGPIGPDDEGRAARVDAALVVGAELLELGFHPFVPHLACSTKWPHIGDSKYERMMIYDFAWLDVCRAVLRMNGASPGADREVARALAQGIPVFYSVSVLCAAFGVQSG